MDKNYINKIRNEYFKGTFSYSFIALIIEIVVLILGIRFIIPVVNFFGNRFALYIITVFLIAIAISVGTIPLFFIRCIIALFIFSKINKQEFLWYIGKISSREAHNLEDWDRKKEVFCVIDGKYYCNMLTSPLYKKETTVYFLYFPETLPWIFKYLDGAVVKKKPE